MNIKNNNVSASVLAQVWFCEIHRSVFKILEIPYGCNTQ